ncbi:MAG TPA: MFS transporter [Bradyrhizobium sp.]
MRNRWGILAVLFTVRVAMSFQFQSVGAIAPLMSTQFGASLADIGLLIGLYFTPGVALALPGGAIGLKFGDKATVLTAIFLMFAGGLAMAFSNLWAGQIGGRLVSGAGGVLLTVQMTKMVADWFAGKEIATAMAIYVVSWPAGIALSLVTLPAIGASYGVRAVQLGVAALIVLGAVLFVATRYGPPATVETAGSAPASARPHRRAIVAVIMAGLIWGLFNVGFATIFSFGPSMLAERGWSIATAGSTISIVLWISVIAVPFGGFVADRSGRPQTLLVGAAIAAGLLMLVFARTDAVVITAIALGLISALPAGPIMSLPARVLAPATRSIGMGIFYTVYYGAMMLGPVGAGAAAKWIGNAIAAFDFGAVMMLVCPVLLWCFNRMAPAAAKTT